MGSWRNARSARDGSVGHDALLYLHGDAVYPLRYGAIGNECGDAVVSMLPPMRLLF